MRYLVTLFCTYFFTVSCAYAFFWNEDLAGEVIDARECQYWMNNGWQVVTNLNGNIVTNAGLIIWVLDRYDEDHVLRTFKHNGYQQLLSVVRSSDDERMLRLNTPEGKTVLWCY
jgi:hypothetical protein